nr:MAG TPA: hypothetical protein [Caudoviricetes sp.]
MIISYRALARLISDTGYSSTAHRTSKHPKIPIHAQSQNKAP